MRNLQGSHALPSFGTQSTPSTAQRVHARSTCSCTEQCRHVRSVPGLRRRRGRPLRRPVFPPSGSGNSAGVVSRQVCGPGAGSWDGGWSCSRRTCKGSFSGGADGLLEARFPCEIEALIACEPRQYRLTKDWRTYLV